MPKIKALSFDMYRTLLDTRDFHEQAVREILTREKADSIDPEVFHSRWDEIYDDVHLRMKPDAFMLEREVAIESLRLAFLEFGIKGDPKAGASIWLKKYDKADLFPEVEEVIHVLAKKYPIVVISNADNDDLGYAVVKKKNLPFTAILTSDTFKSYKPNERLFKEALSILKCRPEEVLHTGDSQRSDVMGAKNAGMLTAWLNRRSQKINIASPDYVIANLREILDLDILNDFDNIDMERY